MDRGTSSNNEESRRGDEQDISTLQAELAHLRTRVCELEKFSLAVAQVPSGIVITDSQGVVEHLNQSFLRLAGVEAEEVLGKSVAHLRAVGMFEPFFAVFENVMRTGGSWRDELGGRLRDGRSYWAFVSICPLTDSKGKVTNYIGGAIDITARKAV